MTQTATILQFVPRADPQRIHRLHRAGIYQLLDTAREAVRKGINQTPVGTTFRIEFDHPLDVHEFGVLAVEDTVRAWIRDRRVFEIELRRYESHPVHLNWSLQFERK